METTIYWAKDKPWQGDPLNRVLQFCKEEGWEVYRIGEPVDGEIPYHLRRPRPEVTLKLEDLECIAARLREHGTPLSQATPEQLATIARGLIEAGLATEEELMGEQQ